MKYLILVFQLKQLVINGITLMNIQNLIIMKFNYSNINQFRLLETDDRLIIPFKISLRLIVSSIDSLGIEVDAIPGRINQLNLFSIRPGLFFGQCVLKFVE
ncbi:hypothetical protein E2986_10975 [Frieseomelitta varia]|uniref:Cytochrome oxidase subunit II copper A binding domain-containing protein n=1 Tax=Frieseomelitta varia TaxID=561572 RepID=A0A833SE97_9HYME|nr:hypothetical protein E2986_10975 [Frieseomelitta varia]